MVPLPMSALRAISSIVVRLYPERRSRVLVTSIVRRTRSSMFLLDAVSDGAVLALPGIVPPSVAGSLANYLPVIRVYLLPRAWAPRNSGGCLNNWFTVDGFRSPWRPYDR